MSCSVSIFAPLYYYIILYCIRAIHVGPDDDTWCTWPFVVIIFFCPSFYSPSFDPFYFLSDIVNKFNSLLLLPWHVMYSNRYNWRRILQRLLRQSPLPGPRGLFSPQSLDDPLSSIIILLANDRKPIAANL